MLKQRVRGSDRVDNSHTDQDHMHDKPRNQDGRASSRSYETGRSKRPQGTNAEVAISWFTFILLVVAIVAAGASYLQWDIARKTLKFAEESAAASARDTQAALRISDRVASATEIGAGAARSNVRLQREGAELALSDFKMRHRQMLADAEGNISLEITDMTPFEPDVYNSFKFNVKNAGSRQLRDVTIKAQVTLNSYLDIWKLWKQLEVGDEGDVVTIASGATVTRPFYLAPLGADSFPIDIKMKAYLILGLVKYTDWEGVRHERYICSVVFGKAGSPSNLLCDMPQQK